MSEIKKYMDVVRLGHQTTVDVLKVGDHITLTEKLDGCFHYDTLITLEDGSKEPIGKIVKNKMNVNVMTYNVSTNKLEPKKIINWYNHGQKKDFICLLYQSPLRQGGRPNKIICTKDHLFFTSNGWKEAGSIDNNDIIYTYCDKMNNIQEQLILGTLLGDSSIYPCVKTGITDSRNRGIVYAHSNKQQDYVLFKNKILDLFYLKTREYISGYGSEGLQSYSICCKPIEFLIKKCINLDNKKYVNKEWLSNINSIGLAFWYMDDGSLVRGANKQKERACFHTEGYTENEINKLIDMLYIKYNIIASKIFYKNKYFRIDLDTKSSEILFDIISPYIIQSMQYKLPQNKRLEKTFWDFYQNNSITDNILYPIKIIKQVEVPKYITNFNNYDIEVEDNNNYFAGGILVHNSNASFILNEDGNIDSFSRRIKLSQDETLRGFYGWIQENIVPIKHLLNPNYRYFGEWLCLSGDTIIKKTSGGKKQGNYMTLREMYNYNQMKRNNGYYKLVNGQKIKSYENKSQWEKEGYPSLYSLFIDKDIIKPNKMELIVFSGMKEVYEVKTRKGFSIKSTLEHRFWTNEGWKQLKDININDCVAVSELRNVKDARRLGKGSRKIKKLYQDLRQNNNCNECGNNTCLEIHHLDRNYKNNDISNLQVLCRDCHSKKDVTVSMKNVSFNYEFDKVISIVKIGIEDCYDIKMSGTENEANFIANNFIVHNCSHKIKYKEEYYNNFYLFNIFDEEKKEYLSDEIMRDEADKLKIKTVPLLYEGKYISFEHLQSFVGKSEMAVDYGEGIVVKNFDYKDRYGNQLFVKLVCDEFREIQKQKAPKDPNRPITIEQEFVDTCLTKARVYKLLHKLVDENILEESFGIEDMGTILKNLGSRVYEDILKEESEMLPKDYEVQLIRKAIGGRLPKIVKDIISEK